MAGMDAMPHNGVKNTQAATVSERRRSWSERARATGLRGWQASPCLGLGIVQMTMACRPVCACRLVLIDDAPLARVWMDKGVPEMTTHAAHGRPPTIILCAAGDGCRRTAGV